MGCCRGLRALNPRSSNFDGRKASAGGGLGFTSAAGRGWGRMLSEPYLRTL